MVTVYIVVYNILIKPDRVLCCLSWRSFFLKFIYVEIVKE